MARFTSLSARQRNAYFIRWLDPVTSKVITKNTGLKINEPKAKAKADRQAADKESELVSGNYAPPTKLDWAGFIERYNKEHLQRLADKSAQKALLVLDRTTNILHPKKPSAITAERLSVLASKLHDEGCNRLNNQKLSGSSTGRVELGGWYRPDSEDAEIPKDTTGS